MVLGVAACIGWWGSIGWSEEHWRWWVSYCEFVLSCFACFSYNFVNALHYNNVISIIYLLFTLKFCFS